MPHHGQQVLQFTATFVVAAGADAHTAKVKTHRCPAALGEGAGQRLHHLVVHGAAKQRVRVGDHRHAPGRAGGRVDGDLDQARFAVDR